MRVMQASKTICSCQQHQIGLTTQDVASCIAIYDDMLNVPIPRHTRLG